MNMSPVLKPTDVGAYLFRVKGELENMLRSVRSWRTSGIDGSGVVPIEVLPLETKIEATLTEVEEMIKLVSRIKPVRKKR
jgi:hypothetical protein